MDVLENVVCPLLFLFDGVGADTLAGGDGNDYLDGEAGDDIAILLNLYRDQLLPARHGRMAMSLSGE